jgi:hypothetical protein
LCRVENFDMLSATTDTAGDKANRRRGDAQKKAKDVKNL